MNTPVIMLTANAIVGAKEEYLNIGFTDYLTKPIQETSLLEMILKYLPKELVADMKNEKKDGESDKTEKEQLEKPEQQEKQEQQGQQESQEQQEPLRKLEQLEGLDTETDPCT